MYFCLSSSSPLDMAGVVGTDGDIRGGHAAGGQLLDDYDTAASL